jgi:thymidine kinase
MSINLIVGPMFAGKSSELLRLCRRSSIAKKSCVLIKSNIDNRYSDNSVTTHDGVTHVCITGTTLAELEEQIMSFDKIYIDEGQFFSDILETSENWASYGKDITIAALDGDFNRNAFGNIPLLMSKAETVVKLTAICDSCSQNAAFTMKLTVDNNPNNISVGGKDKYQAACRKCHVVPF